MIVSAYCGEPAAVDPGGWVPRAPVAAPEGVARPDGQAPHQAVMTRERREPCFRYTPGLLRRPGLLADSSSAYECELGLPVAWGVGWDVGGPLRWEAGGPVGWEAGGPVGWAVWEDDAPGCGTAAQ